MTQTILRLPEVKQMTGLSGSSVYRLAKLNRFPKPIKLGERSSGFIKAEIEEWLQNRIEASRGIEEVSNG